MASIKLKGDTSGEVIISAPSVAGNTTLTLPATSSTLATQNALGVRNRIINGDMKIDQRNAGASVTPANGAYLLDRYQVIRTQASKFSAPLVTDAPVGFTNSMRITSLSAYSVVASDIFHVMQKIEGFNVYDLAWGTASAQSVTVSFWAKSSLTGTFGGSLVNSAEDRSYPFTYTISSANTWEYKTVTVAGDTTGTWLTNNGIGIRCHFTIGVGSNYTATAGAWTAGAKFAPTGATSVVGTSGATLYITGVQLEAGTTATPFEHRMYSQELAMCQRYYEKSWNQSVSVPSTDTGGAVSMLCMANSATTLHNNGVRHNFQYRKRTAPTVTVYPIASTTAGSISYARNGQPRGTGTASLTNSSEMSIRVGGSASGLTAGYAVELLFHYTANAEL
jgi:hypothetical protein